MLDEAPIREAFAIVNTAAMTVEELEAQERRHDFIRLQRGAQEKAHEDGWREGRKEGEIEARQDVARNLLSVLDDAAIAAATGLSLQETARLRMEA
ncbi:MAG: hypothetical protein EPN21_09045 [Methylococcaceae bacterium]|nr:MAG: hypothetical protein EPN21_09045 [Methylococcaceae bacterium]